MQGTYIQEYTWKVNDFSDLLRNFTKRKGKKRNIDTKRHPTNLSSIELHNKEKLNVLYVQLYDTNIQSI